MGTTPYDILTISYNNFCTYTNKDKVSQIKISTSQEMTSLNKHSINMK